MGFFSKKEEIEILPISTTNEIAGRETIEYKGLISASNSNHLVIVQRELSKVAFDLGANAVVGLQEVDGILLATAVVIADKK